MLRNAISRMLLAVGVLLATTGCWDRVEIEDRGFVIGAAIDLASEKTEEHDKEEDPNKPTGKNRFQVTYQMVVTGVLKGQSGGAGQVSSGKGEAYMNVTSEGDTMHEIGKILTTRTSRSPFFEHIKVVIISEEVAKTGQFADVLDFFIRDHEMRRGTKIMIAKGSARKALEVRPRNEPLPVMYIASVSQNMKRTARMVKESRIGDVHEHLLKSESYTIQRITPDNSEVKIAGATVFNGFRHKMVGFLGEMETDGLNFITGDIKGGIVKVSKGGEMIVYRLGQTSVKITADVKDTEHMKFTFHVDTEANLGESMAQEDPLDKSVNKELTELFEKEVKRIMLLTINKTQSQFKTDVLGVGTYLQDHYYNVWKQVKDDWDRGENYFAKSEIDVEVNAQIRRIGAILKSEESAGGL